MDIFIEPQKTLPVYGSYDTVVAGGGFAGIAAALAAARGGNKVLLCEKMFVLGGLGTAGLVTIYLPLCDGMGNQLSFGIAEELLKASIADGYEASYPKAWLENGSLEERKSRRYYVRYNAAACIIAMERLLLEAGVEILYGTSVCSVSVEDSRITHLVLENKSGRSAVKVGNVIDCTGDADICAYSGEETVNHSTGNILAAWFYYCDENGNNLKTFGATDYGAEKEGTKEYNAMAEHRFYSGLDAKELSNMVLASHKSIYNYFLKDEKLSPNHMLTSIATIPQVRMTRRIVGRYTMTKADDHKKFDDSVGMFANWRATGIGEAYELPYSALFGNKIKNLAVAGRCISADDAMWDVTRVIPVCAVSGQAAGTAAALSQDFCDVDVSRLQKKLIADGVKLHNL